MCFFSTCDFPFPCLSSERTSSFHIPCPIKTSRPTWPRPTILPVCWPFFFLQLPKLTLLLSFFLFVSYHISSRSWSHSSYAPPAFTQSLKRETSSSTFSLTLSRDRMMSRGVCACIKNVMHVVYCADWPCILSLGSSNANIMLHYFFSTLWIVQIKDIWQYWPFFFSFTPTNWTKWLAKSWNCKRTLGHVSNKNICWNWVQIFIALLERYNVNPK